MIKDYAVWNIDELVSAYANVPEVARTVSETMEALFKFFETEGLLRCRVTDSDGKLIKRQIMASEITEEGELFSTGPRNTVQRWLGSKGAQKSPPDMKMLEKALAESRSGNLR
ncbi:hypothetical protein BURK_022710 [Burkholderia sp. SJ98]|uniref:hypothetical protein n=1 Tax=Caballeronia sp. GACF5 TaxID=2921746 RepID=UPI00025BA5D5|nr:hypothetical protein [Caballeronia sp. GACF5]EKS67892.1 hypothetical protein BURK_022710 [Burkholderia sp. SJ98]